MIVCHSLFSTHCSGWGSELNELLTFCLHLGSNNKLLVYIIDNWNLLNQSSLLELLLFSYSLAICHCLTRKHHTNGTDTPTNGISCMTYLPRVSKNHGENEDHRAAHILASCWPFISVKRRKLSHFQSSKALKSESVQSFMSAKFVRKQYRQCPVKLNFTPTELVDDNYITLNTYSM